MKVAEAVDELTIAVAEVLRKVGVEQDDGLREGMRVLAQAVMEIELDQHSAPNGMSGRRSLRAAKPHASGHGSALGALEELPSLKTGRFSLPVFRLGGSSCTHWQSSSIYLQPVRRCESAVARVTGI